jgi:predicted nucleic acid-binding protein
MWLLDTNVVSELVRKRPDAAVVDRLRALPADQLFVTPITVMELRAGSLRRPDAVDFWARLEAEILSRVRVVGLNARAGLVAGDLLAALNARGTPIDLADLLIAAIALTHDATLVTRNRRHFERISELRLETWSEPTAAR